MKKLRKLLSIIFNYFKYRNQIFLIYQLGKVGSSSVYKSLRKRLPFNKIYHLHFLSEEWLDKKLPALNEYFHENISLGKQALKYINDNPHKRIKIITLVREPIERELSDVFENWKPRYGNNSEVDMKTEQLIKDFNQNDFSFTLNWFDAEFFKYSGVDIYSLKFDKEKGYSIYQLPQFDILCIKLEKLNECYQAAFKEFINMNFDYFEKSRSAVNKENYELYKEMKNLLRMDREKLKSLYESKYVTHFYSAKEIAEFVEKWGI